LLVLLYRCKPLTFSQGSGAFRRRGTLVRPKTGFSPGIVRAACLELLAAAATHTGEPQLSKQSTQSRPSFSVKALTPRNASEKSGLIQEKWNQEMVGRAVSIRAAKFRRHTRPPNLQ